MVYDRFAVGQAILTEGQRGMPAIDFDRAAAWVRAHGGAFDRARLDMLLEVGRPLSSDLRQRFLAGRRADGGWAPFWAPDYSSLDATCFRLAQCEGLGITFEDADCARAVVFLRARQRADGSWEEDAGVAELAPPWATPGELAPRLYLTANCGWLVAEASVHSTFVTADEAAQRAGAYLEGQMAPDGSLPSFLQTQWLAAGLWIRLGRDDLARRVLAALTEQLNEEVPAGALSWMLTTLGRTLGFEPPVIPRAAALLMARQRADGSWASEDGPERDAYVTVEALRALMQYQAI